ncbi:thiamine-binding protein [Bifidobacterium merycicum]|uniref:thiamine-binding protein n=1 Tax=Bifidobacterium merycicum TaxID=78345 RepID=UPI0023F4DA3A|nr:thiamine-binding protein [Bifidobacterium merycicum]
MVSKKSLAHGGEAALDSLTGSAAAPPRPNRQNAATKRTQLHKFRSHRWSARETNRRILRGTRCAFCGKPTKKGTGVGLYYDPEHGSRFGGLAACGNVNCCPVCNYKIMSQRQNEISQALHACKENGYGVVFGTLTLRHTKADDLSSIRKKLLEVWRNLNKQRAFVKLMDDFGEFGFIRAQEVTYSNVNGWHPHLHAFFLFEHDLSVKRVNEFGARFAALWLKTVERLNAKRAKAGLDADYAAPLIDSIGMPLAKNQIFKRVSLSDSGIDKYAAYCTVRKSVAFPGEDVISRMSHEIADSGTKVGKVKKHDDGRKVLHMNYWDMLEFLRQIGYTGSKKSPIFSIMSEKVIRTTLPPVTTTGIWSMLWLKSKPYSSCKGTLMNCSVAIQFLPMNARTDEETCAIVDEVIAYIKSTGVDYFVGPFETAIEGDFDTCMDIVRNCQLVGAKAGATHVMSYVKINYRPDGEVMTTEHKVGKYHPEDPELRGQH